MSINERMNKEDEVYTHTHTHTHTHRYIKKNETFFRHKEEGNLAIWDNIDGDWGHFLKEIVRQRKTNPVWS